MTIRAFPGSTTRAPCGKVKESDLKKLAIAIFVFCLFEALCYFWTGWWAYSAFRSAGATFSQAFAILKDEWTTGFFILLGGLLHWVAPRLRLPLAVAGVFGGFYAAYFMLKNTHLSYYSWNFLHGDLIAVMNWSEALLIVIALLCATELVIIARDTK